MKKVLLIVAALAALAATWAGVYAAAKLFGPKPQKFALEAQASLDKGDYAGALDRYKSLREKFPDSAESALAAQAITDIENEIAAERLVEQANAIASQGNAPRAIEIYASVMTGYVGTKAANLASALQRKTRKKAYDDALIAAKGLFDSSNWDGAAKAAEDALSFMPGGHEAAAVRDQALCHAFRVRGEEELAAGRKEEALALFGKALEHGSDPELSSKVGELVAELDGIRKLRELIPLIEAATPGDWKWPLEMLETLHPAIDAVQQAVRDPAGAGITMTHTRPELLIALRSLGYEQAVPELVQMLDGATPARIILQGKPEGLYAAFALARFGASSLPVLADRLKGEDAERAKWCVAALSSMGPVAVGALIDGARSKNADVSNAAIEALKRWGRDASPGLAMLLNEGDRDVRARAGEALVSLGPPQADAVFSVLRQLNKTGVEDAGRVLSDMGPGVVASLVTAYARGPGLERQTAERVLRNLGEAAAPQLLEVIRAGDDTARGAALEMMRILGAKAVPTLLEAAGRNDPAPEEVRLALGALQAQVIPGLMTAFRSPNPEIRNSAEIALKNVGPKVLEPLLALIQNPRIESADKLRALDVMAGIGPEAIPYLAAALQSDVPEVRDRARMRIIPFGDGAVPRMRALMRDGSEFFRLQGMTLLWTIKRESALPEIKAMLRDASEKVRVAAVDLVAEAGGDQTVDSIAPLLRDRSPIVRTAALNALIRNRGLRAARAMVRALDGSPPDWIEELKSGIIGMGDLAVQAMREAMDDRFFLSRGVVLDMAYRIGAPGVDLLKTAMDDGDWTIRERAAQYLGMSGNTSVVNPLLRHVRDGAVNVRVAVVLALGRLGDRQAVNVIAERLRNDDLAVKQVAVTALDRLYCPDAMAALMQAAQNDKYASIRALARSVLARWGVNVPERTSPMGAATIVN